MNNEFIIEYTDKKEKGLSMEKIHINLKYEELLVLYDILSCCKGNDESYKVVVDRIKDKIAQFGATCNPYEFVYEGSSSVMSKMSDGDRLAFIEQDEKILWDDLQNIELGFEDIPF